jgi:folate-dependent phosphoribosylglycinamide formyltransferase PurN
MWYDKHILVFNSGSGSGFQELVENSKTGILQANIVALITNNLNYKCVERAKRL